MPLKLQVRRTGPDAPPLREVTWNEGGIAVIAAVDIRRFVIVCATAATVAACTINVGAAGTVSLREVIVGIGGVVVFNAGGGETAEVTVGQWNVPA